MACGATGRTLLASEGGVGNRWVTEARFGRESGPPARPSGREASEDDAGGVDLTTLLGATTLLLAVAALGLSLTAAVTLGAAREAVTAAVAGASISMVVVAVVVGRWWR